MEATDSIDTRTDRNKSDLTHVATATAAAWLDSLGCKPVETEVPLDCGWIADLASFWSPTYTEAKKSKLLKALVPPTDGADHHDSFNRLYRSVGGRLTVLVEVKVSRADFLRDVGRKIGMFDRNGKKPASIPPQAHLCVLACTPDVMREGEHLYEWARLHLSKCGSRVLKFDGCWWANAQHPKQIEDLIAAVAIRRDHHTRYESRRRFVRAYRLRQNDRRAEYERNRDALIDMGNAEA